MKKQFISTKIDLPPYGLLRISAQVERNEYYDGYQQEPYEPPFEVSGLRVIDRDGDDITDELEQIELEKVETALWEKYLFNEQSHRDTLIDDAIERSRSFRHLAYSCFLVLLFALPAFGQQDSLRYPTKTPEQIAGNKKVWPTERLYFQEHYEGTGAGLMKQPDKAWATSVEFRNASVRIVGKDSLLLKFETSGAWKDTVSLGRCNATDLPGNVLSIKKSNITQRPQDVGKTWAGWEILVGWPWDTAFLAREKPFGFFFELSRK